MNNMIKAKSLTNNQRCDCVEFAREVDEVIKSINDDIKFWREMWNKFHRRRWYDEKKEASRFIGKSIEEKELWLNIKEEYLIIGMKQREFVPLFLVEMESPGFLPD